MKLVAFMQAQNCSNYVGSWRDPSSACDFLSPRYYQRVARTLEDACFDMAFFDDRLAMPEIYGRSADLAVRHGIRAVKMDPTIPLMAMASATTRLGLGCTYSTTYHEPFHVARLFQTMDHMNGGRTAWNIVTSLNDAEASNFGRSLHVEHDSRYDRADEFVEIVKQLWTSWEPDALVAEKATGYFADPEKVHRTKRRGAHLTLDGTFPVPRSPQGHPVLIQAGASQRGLDFAGRWADIVFAAFSSRVNGVTQYQAIKHAVDAAGRNPDEVIVAPSVVVITATSSELAAQKESRLRSLAIPEDGLALLSESLNTDFSSRSYDEPFTDMELEMMSFQSMRDRVIAACMGRNPSVRDFVDFSRRGSLGEVPVLSGTPDEVADELEEWFGSCCDGFVIMVATVPGSYEDFCRLVVPVLQRRGLAQREYRGETLRDNLGIPIPT